MRSKEGERAFWIVSLINSLTTNLVAMVDFRFIEFGFCARGKIDSANFNVNNKGWSLTEGYRKNHNQPVPGLM